MTLREYTEGKGRHRKAVSSLATDLVKMDSRIGIGRDNEKKETLLSVTVDRKLWRVIIF